MENSQSFNLDWTHVFDNVEKVKPLKRNPYKSTIEKVPTVSNTNQEKQNNENKGVKSINTFKDNIASQEQRQKRYKGNKNKEDVSIGKALKIVGLSTAGAIAIPFALHEVAEFLNLIVDAFSNGGTEVATTQNSVATRIPTHIEATQQFSSTPPDYNPFANNNNMIPVQGNEFAPQGPANPRPADGELGGWELLKEKVLYITDMLANGVIIFAGISWMFGNRIKAIELLFSFAAGYVVVRHHEDIRNFFAMI